jgi:transglutaminase-like putative cysteine protease
VSTVEARPGRAWAARAAGQGWASAGQVDENVAGLLRLAAFVGLAAYGLAHWLGVVAHPPLGRGAALVGVCAGGGFLLWLTGVPERPGVALRAARPLIVVAMAALALLAMGVPAKLIEPRGWGRFADGIDRGTLGAQSAIFPYRGPDSWVRLTLLLAAPLFLVPAAALGFWPARRSAGAMRGLALAVLVGFFGMALAERDFSGQIGRGLVLLLLIAAWLWLPRLRPRDAGAAAAVVGCAGVLALPVAGKLDAQGAWFDYRNWHWFSLTSGVSYDWNHRYGAIDWPRHGTTLLNVKSDRPYYWKAETLDSFDGRRWFHSGSGGVLSATSEIPAPTNPRWIKEIHVNVASLRSDLVVGAGTPLQVSGLGNTQISADGTTATLDRSVHKGEQYTVSAYVPEPTVKQLRAAPRSYEDYFRHYTSFSLPNAGALPVSPGLRGTPGTAEAEARQLALSSPYARAYRLAQRLAAGAPTTYDVVRRVRSYLLEHYSYSESPPTRKYPLESFLFRDRVGYCQQFSGAMALMLRMDGIPARVAAGFSPGTQTSHGRYRVRDYDAHSWVEVYFNRIGWVTFDPTPSFSPAAGQADDKPGVAGAGGANLIPRPLGQKQGADPSGGGAVPGVSGGGGKLSWWMAPAGLAGIALLALLGLWARAVLIQRRGRERAEAALKELRSALARAGLEPAPATTLAALEGRLQRTAGPDAAHYARLLRVYRYGANGTRLPTSRERRALRRSLSRGRGPLARLRLLAALPPAPHLPRPAHLFRRT